MSNQSNTSNDKPRTVQDIIRTIEAKSADGGYIYRGERKRHTKVSSNLYRDYDDIEARGFDIEVVQKEMLSGAKKHTGHLPHTGDLPQDFRTKLAIFLNVSEEDTAEAIDFEILTEIQHYGGKTNLIDFTTDYFIALFFACDGHHDEDGRVIVQKTEEIEKMIKHPRNPRHRVIAQKSVFVRPPKGFIEPRESEIVIIPANFKELMLQHLRKYHGIFTETIYNDLYGFIRNQDIHGSANTQVYRGLACQNRGDKAKIEEERQEEYDKSIKYYTKAIELKPDSSAAYYNRGIVYAQKDDYELAAKDFTKVIEFKPDDVDAYNNRGACYINTGEFNCAIKDLTKTIELKPNHALAHKNRGAAYSNIGELSCAIEGFTKAIELEPDDAEAYYNRGGIRLCLGEWEKAKADLTTAKDMRLDIIASFHNLYSSISDFEGRHKVKLPEDIASMLTPQQ